MKVSVIIPVYNCEKYLAKCLESVCSQTLKDIEIICVNDGSTDGSGNVIHEYADRDPRIVIVDKKNGGLVSARKAGVASAKGEYVGYVDGDDWIEPDMYERLYELAIQNDADMVCSGYVMEGSYISQEYDSLPEGLYGTDRRHELLKKMIFNMPEKDLGIRGSLCCKLFRRELMQKVQVRIPDDITYSEDKMCMLTYALECSRILVLHEAWYHYMLRGGSMTQKPVTDYLLKVNAVYRYLTSLYTHPDFSEAMRVQAELYVTQLLIKGINTRMGFSIPNTMWIDDDWMLCIDEGARILLFGKGALSDAYVRQINNTERLNVAGCIDDPGDLSSYSYDYILIAFKYKPRADKIKEDLLHEGVSEDRILWFEQKEIFWRYAEAAGLCGRMESISNDP